MTAGSVFSSAGQQLLAGLAPLLPGWRVDYEAPLNEAELASAGELRAVYLDPAGDSVFDQPTTRGWREVCPLTVVLVWLPARSPRTQAEVDDETAEAFGVLLEWVTANRRGAAPDGWDSLDFRFAGMTRAGGYREKGAGRGRRLEVTVEATAVRC